MNVWENVQQRIVCGCVFSLLRYLKPDRVTLDFEGMCEDINAAPAGSVFLLHACAHNPTGVDPSPAQWQAISDLMKSKGHVVFMDIAYQGFATGDADRDAFAVRLVSEVAKLCQFEVFHKDTCVVVWLDCATRLRIMLLQFASEGHNMLLAQSFAKNFGLYGERVGTVSVVTSGAGESERVASQLRALIRPMYSSPPLHGSRIITEILSDPVLSKQW